MINFEPYSYTDHKLDMKRIYEESFPEKERFEFYILWGASLEQDNIRFDCITDNDKPVGIQFMIRIPRDITYLMYFAIDENYRGRKIGSRALKKIISLEKNVVFIIEKVTDKETLSRKKFYLRNGLHETGYSIVDSGIEYEILSSKRGYIPTDKDMHNRYRYMTNDETMWDEIQSRFDTKKIDIRRITNE